MENIKNYCLILLSGCLISCASSAPQVEQFPAPHNNYSGRIIDGYFETEDSRARMIRSCKSYGGIKESTIKDEGQDLLLQGIISYQCKHTDKLDDELNIDGKSSKRLSGTVARKKCENLGFKIGKKSFANCLKELTQ
jgi:hypothetical protein